MLTHSRPISRPIKPWPRISLAPRCNVGMPFYILDRISGLNRGGELIQACVLRVGEGCGVRPFQFNPDRKIIAAFAPAPGGCTRMPGALGAWNKLNQLAIAANKKVAGDFKIFDDFVVRMFARVELVGEELDHARPAKLIWRQADVVDDDQVDHAAFRPRVEIGRGDVARALQQAFFVNMHGAASIMRALPSEIEPRR